MPARVKAVFLVQRKQGSDWLFCTDIAPLYDQADASVKYDSLRREPVPYRIILVQGARAERFLG